MDYSSNISLNSNTELDKYGIVPLTGESCAYSLRLLCDVTEHGEELLDAFFGGVEFTSANWNHGSDTLPHTHSVMLPYSILQDLKVYILLHVEGLAHVIVFADGTMTGTDNKEVVDTHRKYEPDDSTRYFTNPYSPSARDGRNVHMMSGRAT